MAGAVLTGDTIRLTPLAAADADAWLAGTINEAPRFGAVSASGREAVRRQIRGWQASWREHGPMRHWGIRPLGSNELLGGVAVEDAGDGERSVKLEFLVFVPYRRRGIALEAARLALDYAVTEMGATHATMQVDDRHEGALKVARRLGATHVLTTTTDPARRYVVTRLDLKLPT